MPAAACRRDLPTQTLSSGQRLHQLTNGIRQVLATVTEDARLSPLLSSALVLRKARFSLEPQILSLLWRRGAHQGFFEPACECLGIPATLMTAEQ